MPTYEEAMEAKRKEEVVDSSEPREESSRALSWKAASAEGQQEGAPEGGPESTAQSQDQDRIQAADQGDNPTTSAGDSEVPPPYASASSGPSSSDDVAVPSTMN